MDPCLREFYRGCFDPHTLSNHSPDLYFSLALAFITLLTSPKEQRMVDKHSERSHMSQCCFENTVLEGLRRFEGSFSWLFAFDSKVG